MSLPDISVAEILNPLYRAGWLRSQGDHNDFSVLLTSLVQALKIRVSLEEFCSVLPFTEKGEYEAPMGLIDLLNSMASLGKVAHSIRVDLLDLDHRLCPCLFVADKALDKGPNTFAVLERSEAMRSRFKIFRQNGKKPEDFELKGSMKGVAYLFVSEEDNEDALSKKYMEASGHSWFRSLLERFKDSFVPIWLVGGMLTMLSLVAPLFVMLVYDRVIGGHSPETLAPLLVGAVLALSIEAALRTMRAQTLSWYGARLDYIVSVHIFERLVKLPVQFTERASVAAQISRVRAFDAVRAFFTGPQIIALAELPYTVLLLIAISLISGSLVFVPIAAAILYALLFFAMRPSIRTSMRLSASSGNARQEMTIETFEKIDSLRAGGLTSVWFKEFRDRSGRASMAGFHASWLGSVLNSISHGIYLIAGLAVVVVGVLQIWADAMTAGALIASMIITWRILSPMQTLTNALPRLVQLQNAVGQINRLMNIEGEGTGGGAVTRLNDPKGEIDLNKVGLRYSKDTDPVFTGLSLSAKYGELVAITGGNGAGKSTVLKLINGLYHPQAGSIYIDGIDIRQIDPQHLRSHIAYVPQSPQVFHGTIADNLRFANPLADDDMLVHALDAVDLWSFVEKLPLGMLTTIGTQGDEALPAGLAYNIGLARAYVHDTPIMMFDELPYAFLNSYAGTTFKSNLLKWKGNRTVILVTHREDYMNIADQVVLLRHGYSPIVDKPKAVIRKIYEQQEVS